MRRCHGQRKKVLDIDTFGGIVDDFLTGNEIAMQIRLPEGSVEAEIKDNVGLGSTVQFYILLRALTAVFGRLYKELPLDEGKKEELADKVLWKQEWDRVTAQLRRTLKKKTEEDRENGGGCEDHAAAGR